MKRILSIAAFFFVLSCNNDPDVTGPDLTSGKISFTFDVSNDITTFYVVISDTVGNVIQWAKLDNAIKKDFPYPPDSKLANVTIIGDLDDTDGTHYVGVSTYTGIPGGDYNFSYTTTFDDRQPKGQYTLTINDAYDLTALTDITSDAKYLDKQLNGTVETITWGLFDAAPYNLFVQFFILDDRNQAIYKHVFKENIHAGETFVASLSDFDSYTPTPSHAVTYPEASDLTGTWAELSGVWSNGGSTDLFMDYFNSQDDVTLTYPDITNLFPKYRTRITAADASGTVYSSIMTAATPTTTFSNLQASMSNAHFISTKRIEADATGQADFINVGMYLSQAKLSLSFDVYTPMSSKISINPPQFPNDLVTSVPSLALIKGKDFDYFDFYKYNTTYSAFVNASLSGPLPYPDFQQIKSYAVGTSGGRMAIDPKATMERLKRQDSRFNRN